MGESTRFLTNHVSWFMRLATPGGYSPRAAARARSPRATSADAGVAGLHLFTFNQVAETEAWRQGLLAGTPRGAVPAGGSS